MPGAASTAGVRSNDCSLADGWVKLLARHNGRDVTVPLEMGTASKVRTALWFPQIQQTIDGNGKQIQHMIDGRYCFPFQIKHMDIDGTL